MQLSEQAAMILSDSDAVCDFQEESNGDECGRDPRASGDLSDWFFDVVMVNGVGPEPDMKAIVRCPDHW